MVIVMAPDATDSDVASVVAHIETHGGQAFVSRGVMRTIIGVVGTEEVLETLDADGLRRMHALKTGALIRASAVCGAVMGGADEKTIAAIDAYAREVGLAFQIVDDILDVEGESHELGKTAGKDAAGSKPTYPALFGIDRSRVLASEAIDRAKAALLDAKMHEGWLGPIADWIVKRRS